MKKNILFAACGCAALLIASCNTIPIIPNDATPTQLIQWGQDSMEVLNYSAAEAYYNAVIQRYGMDTAIYIEANYELGHMYLKRRRYEKAYAHFKEIEEIYEYAEIGVIPAAFKKLTQIEMEKIPAKYKEKK